MHDAAKAYRVASAHTANQRALEADLLLKAAAAMQAVHEAWPGNGPDLSQALLYNRKLWLLLIASVTSPDNPLPVAIRQNVANLGVFIMKQLLAMVVDPQPEQLLPMIRINCDIAAGLLGRA